MRIHEQAARRAARGFALVYGLLAAGIVAGGYFYYAHFAQHYRAKVDDDLTTIGDLKVREVEQFRRERLADGTFLLKNVSISALVRRFMERPGDGDAKRQLEAWLEKFRESGDYDAVRLLDTNAVTRMSLPAGGPPVSALVSGHLAGILRSGQVTFEDFHRSAYDQRVYLDLLVPIVDEQNGGRPLGVFYLRIDPSVNFYPMLSRWPIPSATAESKLVRRDGNAALYLSELKTRPGTLLRERVPLTDTARTAVMAVLGREGIVHGIDKPGNPVLGYVKSISNAPWFVVLREEESEAYAPVHEQRWLTIDLVAALLIGLGAGFMAIWRGERLRFYRERVDAAEALRQSEDRYQRLFESSPYPAWVYDLETLSFLAVNPAAVVHYGYTYDEFLAMTLKDIHTADDLATLSENVAAPRQLAKESGIWRHCKKDGAVIDVEITSQTLVHDGRPAALAIAVDITERKRAESERERLVATLQDALAQVKTLSGLVPICSFCKKIRDDENYWHEVESYVSRHTDAAFSHGVCPDCMKEHYPEFARDPASGG